MKAMVLEEYKHFVYEEVPEPVIGLDDVLIKIRACGICGSDVHGMDGSTGRRVPPLIMGHEAAGIIAYVGENVKDFVNLCNNRRVLGVSCDEYRQDGAFAEYVAVAQHIIHKPSRNANVRAGGDGRAAFNCVSCFRADTHLVE